MTGEEDEQAEGAAVSSNPMSWLLLPFVATWDGLGWLFGTAIPNLARRVRDALTPIAIRTRAALAAIRERVSELLAPVLRPFTWTYDKMVVGYRRAARALEPTVDKAYAGPIALGKWWQRIRARIVARLRSAQSWLAELAIWKSAKATIRRLRGWVAERVVDPVRNQIRAIRNRLR